MSRFLTLLACISLNAVAQPPVTHSFRLEWTKLNLGGSGGSTVVVSLPAGVPHWVVGTKVTPGATEQVEVADAVFQSSPLSGALRLNQVMAHAPDQVSVSGGSVSIGPASNPNATLVVFVQLATPRTLNIVQTKGLPLSFLVSTAAVVADGSLRSTTLYGDFEVATFAHSLGIPRAQAGILSLKQQNVVLNLTDLRSHLSRYVDFAKVSPVSGPLTIMAQVRVGSDGSVQNVTCTNQSALCGSIVAAISQWSFHPFLSNDQPVSVLAEIPVSVMPTGDVVSAVSPGADIH